MNPFDKLKELGFSDEELKNFFKKQESYRAKEKQIKDLKDSYGMTMHTPSYTPEKLINRINAYTKAENGQEKHMLKEGHKVYNLKQDFDLLGKIEQEQTEELKSLEQGFPNEVYDIVQNFLEEINKFIRGVDTLQEKVNEIVEKNKNNLYTLIKEINDILTTLGEYDEEEISPFDDDFAYYVTTKPRLTDALVRGLSIINS